MKKNKFRGQCIELGQEGDKTWVYGSLVKIGDRRFIVNEFAETEHQCEDCFSFTGVTEVIPATVGQYTGYEDKDKIARWEGDTFRYHGELYALAWNEDIAGFGLKHIDRGYFIDIVKVFHAIFIGNIHTKEDKP